jgi:type IV pilus assembly protein PilV
MQLSQLRVDDESMKTFHHSHRPRGIGARRAHSAGFALIEVLVAVLLFAIGILGIVGLQASMLQAQTDSKVRADAANLVDEVAALMWSQVNKGKPAPATLANIVQFKSGACAGDLTCNGWLTKVKSTLPGGALDQLSFDETVASSSDAEYGQVTIQLSWTMPNGASHKYIATFNVAPSTI